MTNKTILITGGTSGIGKALALELLSLGNTVIVTGRNEKTLDEMRLHGCFAHQADVLSRVDLEDLIVYLQGSHGVLDVLVNNAGVQYNYDYTGDMIPSSLIASELHTNATGCIELTRLAIPLLYDSSSPVIVNVTSALGYVPKTNALTYSASKAALVMFTATLRTILPKPFFVVEVIPPVVKTQMTRGRVGSMMSPETMARKIVLGLNKKKRRITTPAVAFLLIVHRFLPNLATRIVNKG